MFIAMHFTLTHPSELQSSISITFISTLLLVHTHPSHHTTRSHVALRFIIMFSHMHIHTTCAYVLTCTYTPHKHMLSRAHTHHIYRSVPHIRPLSRISPPYVFSQSSCTGIFISRIGPPTMAILPKSSSLKLLHCHIQGPRGSARTEPASTEQLRNLPSIASVSASGVNQQQHIERTRRGGVLAR